MRSAYLAIHRAALSEGQIRPTLTFVWSMLLVIRITGKRRSPAGGGRIFRTPHDGVLAGVVVLRDDAEMISRRSCAGLRFGLRAVPFSFRANMLFTPLFMI
jgi:hypothetical protein